MLRNHPRGLFPLFFTEMWERFSFYTMGALLTLYMDAPESQGGLVFDPKITAQVYGLYNGFVYFTPLFGGLLADRLWGFIRAVTLGGVVMMLGHLALAGEGLAFFFTGLALLIVGNGLFKPNISAMLGNLYREQPALKDQGFNIFYMGINMGAMAAPLTANVLKNEFGWHVGFGSAALGMLVSLVIFLACRQAVAAGDQPAFQRDETRAAPAAPVPPEVERLRMQALLTIFVVVILFWMAFKQNGLTLTRWARDHTSEFLGIDFSQNASLTLAINPFLVIVLTPLLVLFWESLKRGGLLVSTPRKMAIGMLLTAACFLVMGIAGLQLAEGDRGRVSIMWLLSGYVLVTLGELCVSPMGLSVVSKLAPARYAGLLMGGWFVATSIGAYLSGALKSFGDTLTEEWFGAKWTNATFFFVLVGTSLFAAAVLFTLLRKLESAMPVEGPEVAPAVPTPEPEPIRPVLSEGRA